MSETNWIAKQVAEKRKDEEILSDLIKKGWTLEDAQKAINAAKKPTVVQQLSRKEKGIFAFAILGIFLLIVSYQFLIFGMPNRNPTAAENANEFWSIIFSQTIIAALTIIAISFFLWSLYECSIRREHPRLHKMFFLITSAVIGLGLFCWMVFLTAIFFIITHITIYTITILIILSIIYMKYIFCIEYSYNHLKQKYDNSPPKKILRLTIFSIFAGLLIGAVLFATIYTAENIGMQKIYTTYSDGIPQINSAKDNIDIGINQMPNSILRSKLHEEFNTIKIEQLSNAKLTPQDVLYDKMLENNMPAITSINDASKKLSSIVQILQEYQKFETDKISSNNHTNVNASEYNSLINPNTPQENTNIYSSIAIFNTPLNFKLLNDAEKIGNSLSNNPNSLEQEKRALLSVNTINPSLEEQDIMNFAVWSYHAK